MNIVFAGTPEFAAQHLAGLISGGIAISAVVTQPDKPGKRGKKLIPSPVKVLADSHQLPVMQPKKFVADDLASIKPDLLIVVAYGQILRQSLLDLPTYGCINVHGSLLPRWRGAAPIQRAIEAGDSETGICIMQMDAGLDTGPVLYEARTTIQPTDTSGDLAARLAELGIDGLLRVIRDIQSGQASPHTQSEDGANYAKKIDKSEARIDWSATGRKLLNQIHAFNPDPVCFCELDDKGKPLRVKFHRAQLGQSTSNQNHEPGSILGVSPAGVEIATIDGSIIIEQLQLPLGKGSILSGRDVMNSRADLIYPGVKLA